MVPLTTTTQEVVRQKTARFKIERPASQTKRHQQTRWVAHQLRRQMIDSVESFMLFVLRFQLPMTVWAYWISIVLICASPLLLEPSIMAQQS